MTQDETYMARALQLAANGRGYTSPNPMVGAVITARGRVIGEGWHRQVGQAHAEVNAVASVAPEDLPLLTEATMYVTLEPCSHFGRTPPCALMVARRQIPRVVVATTDPNPRVSGRGIGILREAGAQVTVGVLEGEAQRFNCEFFTAQTLKRPFITLKWAQSADGFMDWERDAERPGACRFSTPFTSLTTAQLRSCHGAVITTAATAMADHPRLNVRQWQGRQPRPVILDRHVDLREYFHQLFEKEGLTGVLVEAGPRFLGELIKEGLWDKARVEISPTMLAREGAHTVPVLAGAVLLSDTGLPGGNRLLWYGRAANPYVV